MQATYFSLFADGALIADRVQCATGFWQRLCGLLTAGSLTRGAGLLLDPGGSVHTVGMRFTIDVVFLDRHCFVLATRSDVAPNRACCAPRRTHSTLELWAGACADLDLRTGQQLIFSVGGDEPPLS